MRRKKYDFDLIILGSGGAGSVAAYASLRSGKKVAVVEPEEMGGECPNWGCVPTKALLRSAEIYDDAVNGGTFGIKGKDLKYDYPAMKAWRDLAVHRTGTWEGKKIFEASGITVISGAAHFIDSHEVTVGKRSFSAKKFLIATGTKSFVPPIQGLKEAGFITFKEATNFTHPPKSIFIIGAGPIGCEFAEFFSVFGVKVSIADITPRLMMKEDVEVGELAHKHLEKDRGIKIFLDTKVERVVKEGKTKKVYFKHGGKTSSEEVEEVMIAAGKRANVDIGLENAGVKYNPRAVEVNRYMQTSAPHIFAAGDVVGPYLFTHMAEYQSRLAANNMWKRRKIAVDYRAVPRCVFLNPEIASVGLSEEDCQTKKLKIKKAIAPVSLIGRSNTSNVEEGFVKVIAKADGKLLGASIVSPRAGEMIHELTLAIQKGLTAHDVASTIHAFPTWSEAVRIACAKIK